jgi:formylglycine-generating enzyme required for sulfatase activity
LGELEQWTEGTTPETFNGKLPDVFPWEGAKSPPPKGAGNYSDTSRKSKAEFPSNQKFVDHDDGYPTTAPVMSFKPNKLGLYDLGGNVWEWCEDWFEVGTKRLLRGAAWTAAGKEWENSSRRLPRTPDFRASSYGFRVVLEVK